MIIRQRTRAFILKKIPRGDSDYVFTAYTRDFGKIFFLGKGIRKINSKLKSSIELFSVSDIEFIQGKTGKKLVDAIPVCCFLKTKKSYKDAPFAGKISLSKLIFFLKISNTLNELIKGEEKDNKVWLLLREVCLEAEKNKNLALLYYYFLWNLFSILGYSINTEQCFFCRKKLSGEQVFFLPKEKSFIDKSCFKKSFEAEQISPEELKLIIIFFQRKISIIGKIKQSSLPVCFLEKISRQSMVYCC